MSNNENFEHCRAIAERLEKVVNGDFYKCPECGEIIEWEDEQYNGESETYKCPCCGEEIEESELETYNIYDEFTDNVYDIEYRIGSDRKYRSVEIMVACGGPNIYIDTGRKAVVLYWWNESAECPLNKATVGSIDEVFEELYCC